MQISLEQAIYEKVRTEAMKIGLTMAEYTGRALQQVWTDGLRDQTVSRHEYWRAIGGRRQRITKRMKKTA